MSDDKTIQCSLVLISDFTVSVGKPAEEEGSWHTCDFLTKKMAENNGDLEQYYIKDNHPGIVSREDWDAVQIELERRERFRQTHGIRNTGSCNYDRFYSRVFCGSCGGKLVRKAWKGMKEPFWKCENAEKKKGHTCAAENITEAALRKAVVIAWIQIVAEREKRKAGWERLAAEGDALERYRSRLMLAVTADGPLDGEIPELTRMFLEEILVHTPTDLTVRFLDGMEKRVRTD